MSKWSRTVMHDEHPTSEQVKRNLKAKAQEERVVAVDRLHKLVQRPDGAYIDRMTGRAADVRLGRFKSPREAIAVWRGHLRAGVMDI